MASRLLYSLAGCAVILALNGSVASAYCRTHTKDQQASSCPEMCTMRGEPLAWPQPNIEYAFNERGFPGLSMSQLRSIFTTSFRTWESVRCDGQSVGIKTRALAQTTKAESGHDRNGPNQNVILHYDAEQWAEHDFSSRAFAITAVWYNSENGDILGADMMFNGGMDPFGPCSSQGCGPGDPRTDLQNVATHEIGHMLGLSHSAVKASTMYCDADTHEISKRDLHADDIAGLCDIYPPGIAFRSSLSSSPDSGVAGCSASGAGRSGGFGLAAGVLAALGLAWRRRRR